MEFKIESQELTIFIKGRIDTVASTTFKSEIIEICNSTAHTSLILEAGNLEFISSSGLRVILALAKTEKNMMLVNVSQDIYNIFEMTGFTRIVNIEKALRKIDLTDCQVLGVGGVGAVYRISEDEIVKVNYNKTADAEIEEEVNKAKEAFVLGVPTAISFDIVDCGNGNKGVIYEAIKSKTLGEILQADNSQVDILVPKYIDLLHELHNIHTDNPVFGNAKENFRQQAIGACKYFEPEEAAMLMQVADALPDGDCLVHCDAHPKNVMVQNGEMMWIDMSMMSIGHPLYDLITLSTIFNAHDDADCIHMFGMDVATLNKVSQAFLRFYFHTDDPEQLARLTQMMGLIRLIRSVFALYYDTPGTAKYRPLIIASARKYFFPNVRNIIGAIQYLSKF